MARKKFLEELEGHDRWLLSYADLVTLLFAFFVMLYALTTSDQAKHVEMAQAISAAFGKPAPVTVPGLEPIITPVLAKAQPMPLAPLEQTHIATLRRERDHLTLMAESIRTVLAPLLAQGQVRVTQTSRGVGVEINASILFAPGDAGLTGESGKSLNALAAVMRDDTHAIQVEGHTDNLPISNHAFASNWELSAVRAAGVVRLLIDQGIAPTRLAALGYGENQPVADNATAAGRLRNRRVQLTILSAAGAAVIESVKDEDR